MENNISPMAMIRIVKNLSIEDMAKIFKITPTYLQNFENYMEEISLDILEEGLNKIGISIDDYLLLHEYYDELNNNEMSFKKRYILMLIETLNIVEPKLIEQSENTFNSNYYNKSKIKA